MNKWSRIDQELWGFDASLCELKATGDIEQEWGDHSSLSEEDSLLTL